MEKLIRFLEQAKNLIVWVMSQRRFDAHTGRINAPFQPHFHKILRRVINGTQGKD